MLFLPLLWLQPGIVLISDWQRGSYDISREQLIHTELAMPAEPEKVGRGAVYRFPLAKGTGLSCSARTDDPCPKAYRYAGEPAEVFHYRDLAYEIRSGGETLYRFDEQTERFKHDRLLLHYESAGLFAISLVLLWFSWRYRRLAAENKAA